MPQLSESQAPEMLPCAPIFAALEPGVQYSEYRSGAVSQQELNELYEARKELEVTKKELEEVKRDGILVIDSFPTHVAKKLAVLDVDGDGTLSGSEIVAGIDALSEEKTRTRHLMRLTVLLVLLAVFLLASMGGMMWFVVSAAKESHIRSDGTMFVKGTEEPVKVGIYDMHVTGGILMNSCTAGDSGDKGADGTSSCPTNLAVQTAQAKSTQKLSSLVADENLQELQWMKIKGGEHAFVHFQVLAVARYREAKSMHGSVVVIYSHLGELNIDGEEVTFHESMKGVFERAGLAVTEDGRRLLGVTDIIGMFNLFNQGISSVQDGTTNVNEIADLADAPIPDTIPIHFKATALNFDYCDCGGDAGQICMGEDNQVVDWTTMHNDRLSLQTRQEMWSVQHGEESYAKTIYTRDQWPDQEIVELQNATHTLTFQVFQDKKFYCSLEEDDAEDALGTAIQEANGALRRRRSTISQSRRNEIGNGNLHARYNAGSFDKESGLWRDISGNGRHSVELKGPWGISVQEVRGHGAAAGVAVKAVAGGTEQGIRFPHQTIPDSEFTMCSLARYTSEEPDARKNLLSACCGPEIPWYSLGWWQNSVGDVKLAGDDPNRNNRLGYAPQGTETQTDWAVVCAQHSTDTSAKAWFCSRGSDGCKDITRSNQQQEDTNGNAGLAINWMYWVASEWEVSEIAIWATKLSVDDLDIAAKSLFGTLDGYKAPINPILHHNPSIQQGSVQLHARYSAKDYSQATSRWMDSSGFDRHSEAIRGAPTPRTVTGHGAEPGVGIKVVGGSLADGVRFPSGTLPESHYTICTTSRYAAQSQGGIQRDRFIVSIDEAALSYNMIIGHFRGEKGWAWHRNSGAMITRPTTSWSNIEQTEWVVVCTQTYNPAVAGSGKTIVNGIDRTDITNLVESWTGGGTLDVNSNFYRQAATSSWEVAEIAVWSGLMTAEQMETASASMMSVLSGTAPSRDPLYPAQSADEPEVYVDYMGPKSVDGIPAHHWDVWNAAPGDASLRKVSYYQKTGDGKVYKMVFGDTAYVFKDFVPIGNVAVADIPAESEFDFEAILAACAADEQNYLPPDAIALDEVSTIQHVESHWGAAIIPGSKRRLVFMDFKQRPQTANWPNQKWKFFNNVPGNHNSVWYADYAHSKQAFHTCKNKIFGCQYFQTGKRSDGAWIESATPLPSVKNDLEFVISFWMRRDKECPAWSTVMSCVDPSQSMDSHVLSISRYSNTKSLRFFAANSLNSYDFTSDQGLAEGATSKLFPKKAWIHITWVMQRDVARLDQDLSPLGTWTIFRNGKVSNVFTGASIPDAESLQCRIGSAFDQAAHNGFKGWMDDVLMTTSLPDAENFYKNELRRRDTTANGGPITGRGLPAIEPEYDWNYVPQLVMEEVEEVGDVSGVGNDASGCPELRRHLVNPEYDAKVRRLLGAVLHGRLDDRLSKRQMVHFSTKEDYDEAVSMIRGLGSTRRGHSAHSASRRSNRTSVTPLSSFSAKSSDPFNNRSVSVVGKSLRRGDEGKDVEEEEEGTDIFMIGPCPHFTASDPCVCTTLTMPGAEAGGLPADFFVLEMENCKSVQKITISINAEIPAGLGDCLTAEAYLSVAIPSDLSCPILAEGMIGFEINFVDCLLTAVQVPGWVLEVFPIDVVFGLSIQAMIAEKTKERCYQDKVKKAIGTVPSNVNLYGKAYLYAQVQGLAKAKGQLMMNIKPLMRCAMSRKPNDLLLGFDVSAMFKVKFLFMKKKWRVRLMPFKTMRNNKRCSIEPTKNLYLYEPAPQYGTPMLYMQGIFKSGGITDMCMQW